MKDFIREDNNEIMTQREITDYLDFSFTAWYAGENKTHDIRLCNETDITNFYNDTQASLFKTAQE